MISDSVIARLLVLTIMKSRYTLTEYDKRDIKELVDAYKTQEQEIHALKLWSHMHQITDHACGECRALRRIMGTGK